MKNTKRGKQDHGKDESNESKSELQFRITKKQKVMGKEVSAELSVEEETWNAIQFPTKESLLFKKNDFVRKADHTLCQFFVVGKVRFAHIGKNGTVGVFKDQDRDTKQISIQGDYVHALHEKLSELLPVYSIPTLDDQITLRRPLQDRNQQHLIVVDKEKQPIDGETVEQGHVVICTFLLKHYHYLVKQERREGYSFHLLAVRLIDNSADDFVEVVELGP